MGNLTKADTVSEPGPSLASARHRSRCADPHMSYFDHLVSQVLTTREVASERKVSSVSVCMVLINSHTRSGQLPVTGYDRI